MGFLLAVHFTTSALLQVLVHGLAGYVLGLRTDSLKKLDIFKPELCEDSNGGGPYANCEPAFGHRSYRLPHFVTNVLQHKRPDEGAHDNPGHRHGYEHAIGQDL